MKKIAIFCDGTWNSPTMEEPTSVCRLSENCVNDATQVTIYLPGVGVGVFGGKIRQILHKFGGGAFGWGLAANVKKAYAALCEVYEKDDEIYIFGFSRGAYTARSLAGMIRKCGIIPKKDIGPVKLARAWWIYKKGGEKNRPDGETIWKARKKLSPDVATSPKDLKNRNDHSHMVNIAYIGVWDTVGALGIPEGLVGPLARLWNWRYRFHDMELSETVKSARHAVAIDEQRVFFEPTLWDNLTGRDGLNKGDRSPDRPYQQIWFIGSHGIVGGSSESRPLVAYPYEWIAEGAHAKGLKLKKPPAELADHEGDPLFETKELTDPGLVYAIAPHLKGYREGLMDPICCHASVRDRVRQMESYRPGTLKVVAESLLTMTPFPFEDDDPTPEARRA